MSLELIMGPMFAGKSSELQSIVKRHTAIGQNVLVVKHSIDVRYLTVSDNSSSEIINHDKHRCSAVACELLCSLLGRDDFINADLIIIDEGQFFEDLVEFTLKVVEDIGKDLIVVGLDGDAHRKPFGQLLNLVPLADRVKILSALCMMCGNGSVARFSSAKSKKVLDVTKTGVPNVGDDTSYMPLCRKHYLEVSRDLQE